MTIEKKLLGTNPVATGGAGPEAVSFDGSNDYLRRTTNLIGNSDTQTFTCSFWVYRSTDQTDVGTFIYLVKKSGTTSKLEIYLDAYWQLKGRSSGGSIVFDAYTDGGNTGVPLDTWTHVVMSFDLTNTSRRFVYVNGVDISSNFTWDVFSGTIDTSPTSLDGFTVLSAQNGTSNMKGRMSNFFLDYTYRDLSVASNRLLFIDSDGKPASGQADLAPIIYLPMTDAATAGSNSGTGGDFTVNGVLATAERGPNQDNCSASVFDGVGDYLNKTGMSAGVGVKQLTISCIRSNATNAGNTLAFGDSAAPRSTVRLANNISAEVKNTSNVEILVFQPEMGYKIDANAHVTISFDLTDTSKRHVYVNGLPLSVTWNTYTNDSFDVYQCTAGAVGADRHNGTLGEFFIDTTYYDLATENPFWDSELGKPNSVRKVIADTGVTPLIALPIIGSDAGNNLGSGGDFTVNSGPYTGARGGSEFWSRGADFNGSTGYLSKSGVFPSDSKTISLVIQTKRAAAASHTLFLLNDVGFGLRFLVDSSNALSIYGTNTGGSGIISSADISNALPLTDWNTLVFSVDMADSTKTNLYINGNSFSITFNNFVDDTLGISANNTFLGMGGGGTTQPFNGDMSTLYFTTDYIDFSQEANRNKFVDQLGYPKDLTQQIEDGDIPNPLIYMKFDDTAALGTNSGTGGNFTINGTVAAGSDFTK